MRWLAASLIVLAASAEAHDPYSNWKQPDNGYSCCNGKDCEPTRAYKDEFGYWRALNRRTGQYMLVPPAKVLPPDMLKDGRNHLCVEGEYVRCFSPAEPKS